MSEKEQQPTPAGNQLEPHQPASQEIVDRAKLQSIDYMNPVRWEMMNKIASTFMQSGALPSTIKNAPQLIMVMQAGFEAGLQPIESLNSFYFVNGKISMFGEMVIAQVRRAGHKIAWTDCNAESATVTIERGDTGESLTTTFTMAQAKARGLDKNDVYRKYPENMLKYRAFGMTAKFICPEALHGVPIKEELESSAEIIDESGKVVAKVDKSVKVNQAAGHAPLADELNHAESETVDKPKKKEKKAKKDEAESESDDSGSTVENSASGGPYEDVLTDDTLTDKQKIEKLINQELEGRRLTEDEQRFIAQNTKR